MSVSDTDIPWWKGMVLYQIYPRSFQDSNGDGVGDLSGIIQRLDYVADLGVDGIWLSPFFTSPMADFGYDVADYCSVDPIFGTLKDFDQLIAATQALGLKVIIDQVYSHTSDRHAWFAESRQNRSSAKADWYVWADPKPDGAPPNNWQSVFGGPAWEWDARRGQYYLHNFLKEQPDLNLHTPAVQDALLAVGRFWLERGVDGFRLDAINFAMHDPALTDNPSSGVPANKASRPYDMQRHTHNMSQPGIADFLTRVRALLDAYGGKFAVAEVVGDKAIDEMKRFTDGDDHLHSAYNFDFLYAGHLTPHQIARSMAQWTQGEAEGWPSWAFSNHDAPRAISRWASPEHREDMARLNLMLLLCLRGNPILYQGEELGLPQGRVPFEKLKDPEAIANWPKTLGRDGARTPFPWTGEAPYAGFSSQEPWLPVDEDHLALAVSEQHAARSCLNFCRTALALRGAHPALIIGRMAIDVVSDAVLVVKRRTPSDQVICVFNLSPTPAAWPSLLSDPADVLLCSRPDARLGADQGLPAYTAAWVSAPDHP